MTIGEMIKNRRKELKMTQDDLAHSVGTTKATVSRWESGDIHKMKANLITSVCNALGLDPILFCQREEILFPDEAKIIDAYRNANDAIRMSVKILLGVKDEE